MIIALEGMKFHAAVGFYPEEKVLGSEIELSVYVEVNMKTSDRDRLEDTLDYAAIFDAAKKILEQEMHLLETACHKIQLAVAALSNEVTKVKVRIAKIHPPVAGKTEKIFVEDEWVRS
jgi:dihydroneopterin aldolase